MAESPPVVVRRSRLQGKGVFATRDIAEGERIIEYTGTLITNAEADAETDDEGMRRHHTFLFGVDDEYTIDASRGGNEAHFINHSCDPCCESVTVRRRVYIHAIRDIEAGEELTYDYWYTTDERYTLGDLRRIYPCRCRSATCRGTLARPPRRRWRTG
ncbi:MAG: SET domain-containing protein [Polyangiaceae bacterium]